MCANNASKRSYSNFHTAWIVSVFGIFLVRIFPHSDWIWKDSPYLSIFSPNAGNKGPENSECGHFSRSTTSQYIFTQSIKILDEFQADSQCLINTEIVLMYFLFALYPNFDFCWYTFTKMLEHMCLVRWSYTKLWKKTKVHLCYRSQRAT